MYIRPISLETWNVVALVSWRENKQKNEQERNFLVVEEKEGEWGK